jgi:hypothetical protein
MTGRGNLASVHIKVLEGKRIPGTEDKSHISEKLAPSGEKGCLSFLLTLTKAVNICLKIKEWTGTVA